MGILANTSGFDPDSFSFNVPRGLQLDSLSFTSMDGTDVNYSMQFSTSQAVPEPGGRGFDVIAYRQCGVCSSKEARRISRLLVPGDLAVASRHRQSTVQSLDYKKEANAKNTGCQYKAY